MNFSKIKSFFKNLFNSKEESQVEVTEVPINDTGPELSTLQNETKENFTSSEINEPDMATHNQEAENFFTKEPLINCLADFLAQRLRSLAVNDFSVFEIPEIPDWKNCGYTLSENFAAFMENINEKIREDVALMQMISPNRNESNHVNSNGRAKFKYLSDDPEPKEDFGKELKNELNKDEKWLLILSLVPNIYPHFYDEVIFRYLRDPGEYPQLGFIRGKDFRGFIPTGETAFFLLAGNNYDRRLEIQKLFQADHLFAKKKIVWLEELSKGEPVMSGKIILSQDYLETIMFGKPVPPVFSMNFPAKQIQTELTWDDLVINDDLQEQISTIMSWLRSNNQLMNDTNMRRRLVKGYRSLFYGPSGTGKTFTAGLLGKCVGKPVYKIDLSMVVSKYIGETEKNLELLFARAEDKGWILFFDEADAIFGKRTNVRDAHDKYANQEVSYLLQRIDDYNGLVILTTNMKNNIDDAFIRRFNSILKFPFPDAEHRASIWRKSLPHDALFRKKPLINDKEESVAVEIDIPEAVKKYELTGGNIINVVHYACLKAVESLNEENKLRKEMGGTFDASVSESDSINGDPCFPKPKLTVYLSDVLDGIRRELIKEGKPFVS